MSVERVIQRLQRIRTLVSGVTVSGGEATLQADFVQDLFQAIKTNSNTSHLTTMVDSNGVTETETWNRLSKLMDYAAIDLKAFYPDVHERLTGQGNGKVLASIRELGRRNKLLEIRILLIGGINDTEKEAKGTGAFLSAELTEVPVRLLSFRREGVRQANTGLKEPSEEKLSRYRRILLDSGIKSVRVG